MACTEVLEMKTWMTETKQHFMSATDTYFEKMSQVRPQLVKIVDQCSQLMDEKLSLEAENRLLRRKVSEAEETIQQLQCRVRPLESKFSELLLVGNNDSLHSSELVPQGLGNGAPQSPAPGPTVCGGQGNQALLWSPRTAELEYLQMENANHTSSFESMESSQQRDGAEFRPRELIIKVESNDFEEHFIGPSDYGLNNLDTDSTVISESVDVSSVAQRETYADSFNVERVQDSPVVCRISGTSSLAKTGMDNAEAYSELAQGNVLPSDLQNTNDHGHFLTTSPENRKRKTIRKKKDSALLKKRKTEKSSSNGLTVFLTKAAARDALQSVVLMQSSPVEDYNYVGQSVATIPAKKRSEIEKNDLEPLQKIMPHDSKRRVKNGREEYKKAKRSSKAPKRVASTPAKASPMANDVFPPSSLKAVAVRWIGEGKTSKIQSKDIIEEADRNSIMLGQTISVKFGRRRYINACVVENIIYK